MDRRASQSPYAQAIGFSSSVAAEATIYLAGVSAVDADGNAVGGSDAGAQAAECFRKIREELSHHGATMSDVVHTRMYLTSAGDWRAVGAEHAKAFGESRPAATMIVAALLGSDMLVEVEVVACRGS